MDSWPLKKRGSMTDLKHYALWLEDRGLTLPLYNQKERQTLPILDLLLEQGFEVQYTGSLDPHCLFILDSHDLEEWQGAYQFMLRIASALGLSYRVVGVIGILNQDTEWPAEVNMALKEIVYRFTGNQVSQILAVGEKAHRLLDVSIPFETAAREPHKIEVLSKEISYLALWDYREMNKQPSLKKAAWVAMQKLINH